MKQDLKNARDAVAKVLAGKPPNGISPDSCGEYGEAVQVIYDAHADGGMEEARKRWKLIREEFPALRDELAGGKVHKVHRAPVHSRLKWIDFPTETLPEEAASYASGLSSAYNVATAMIAAPMLSVLAAAVGNTRSIQLRRTWSEGACFWSVVISRSGTLKSPSMDAALKPSKGVEAELKQEYDYRLEEWKSQPEGQRGEKPKYHRRLVNDATVESVGLLHSDNPRGLLLYRDELAGFLGSFNQYNRGEADMQKWIEFHDGRHIIIDRKTGDIPTLHIEHPCVSLTGTIQPDVLNEKLKPAHFQSGFTARLFMVQPPEQKRRWSDADITPETREGYHRLVRGLYDIPMPMGGKPKALAMTADAKAVYVDFYNANADLQDRIHSGPLRSCLSKVEAAAARLALVFQLCHDPASDKVALPAMERGVHLAKWLRHEAARVYQLHGFDERGVSRDVQLVRKLDPEFGWRDVSQLWEVKKRGAYKVIGRLEEMDLVEDAGHGKWKNLTEVHKGTVHFVHFDEVAPTETPEFTPFPAASSGEAPF